MEKVKTPTSRYCSDTGQALVEFVIILIFIMAMCAGMISSIRLLGLQFWAQQEARFLAYEQEWAPHDFYGDPVNDPIGKLNDGQFFGRPQSVSDRSSNKNVNDDGAVRQLLAWLKPLAKEKAVGESTGEDVNPPTLFARNEDSLWKGKTSDWFRKGGTLDKAFSLVDTAVASVDFIYRVKSEGVISNDIPTNPFPSMNGNYQDRLQVKIKNYFNHAEVGPKVCGALQKYSQENSDPPFLQTFRSSDCAENINDKLSWNLAHNVDIKDFFRGYGERIESGFAPSDAIETSVRVEVAEQFYSLFDNLVQLGQLGAVPAVVAGRVDTALNLADSSVSNLISHARYLGSSVAVIAILAQATNIGFQNPSNRSSDSELAFENSVNDILHMDADDALPGGAAFFLGPQFLPVPPTFGAAAGGLQEAVMKNLLAQSQDDGIRADQIENSNKMIEVSYQSQGGFADLSLARENIRGVDSTTHTARYYLVTQPWHMTRRQNGTGDYRDKGTQTDDTDAETEEGVMRRRVFGLFLFPSAPSVFLEPIADIAGLGDDLQGVFDAFSAFDTVINTLKDVIFIDNPLIIISDALSKIPFIGDFVPVFPKFPAVRPDAYPGSSEMTGNDTSQPDKLMNSDRNFSDYVDEQRDNDPEPNPTFN